MAVLIPADYAMPEAGSELLRGLVGLVFRQGDERSKARAMLCLIYHTVRLDGAGGRGVGEGEGVMEGGLGVC